MHCMSDTHENELVPILVCTKKIISKAFNKCMFYMFIRVNSAVGMPVYILPIKITRDQSLSHIVEASDITSFKHCPKSFALGYLYTDSKMIFKLSHFQLLHNANSIVRLQIHLSLSLHKSLLLPILTSKSLISIYVI